MPLKNKAQFDRQAPQGALRYVRDDNLLFVQWKDKRVVHVVSTRNRGNDFVEVARKRVVDGHLEEYVLLCSIVVILLRVKFCFQNVPCYVTITKTVRLLFRCSIESIFVSDCACTVYRYNIHKPLAIEEYNQAMGGVDKFDQMAAAYRVLRRSRKWWRCLFLDEIDVAAVNSYILFKKYQAANPGVLPRPPHYEQVHFREALVRQLGGLEEYESPPLFQKGRKRKRVRSDHIPTVSSTAARRNCFVCYTLFGREIKSRFSCAGCHLANGNTVALCLSEERNCFEVYHSEQFDAHR